MGAGMRRRKGDLGQCGARNDGLVGSYLKQTYNIHRQKAVQAVDGHCQTDMHAATSTQEPKGTAVFSRFGRARPLCLSGCPARQHDLFRDISTRLLIAPSSAT
jgi:hypothetical protein